jgi:hypothetical protein
MARRTFHRGSALIACIIVLTVVATMAVALASLSRTRLEMAARQSQGARAFANAESGLEVTHYWLSRACMPSTTPPAQYTSTAIVSVQTDLAASGVIFRQQRHRHRRRHPDQPRGRADRRRAEHQPDFRPLGHGQDTGGLRPVPGADIRSAILQDHVLTVCPLRFGC